MNYRLYSKRETWAHAWCIVPWLRGFGSPIKWIAWCVAGPDFEGFGLLVFPKHNQHFVAERSWNSTPPEPSLAEPYIPETFFGKITNEAYFLVIFATDLPDYVLRNCFSLNINAFHKSVLHFVFHGECPRSNYHSDIVSPQNTPRTCNNTSWKNHVQKL